MKKISTKTIGIILAIISFIGMVWPSYAQWNERTYSILEEQAKDAAKIVTRLNSHTSSKEVYK